VDDPPLTEVGVILEADRLLAGLGAGGAGRDRMALHDAVLICALLNFRNRMVEAWVSAPRRPRGGIGGPGLPGRTAGRGHGRGETA
jgi:hypothetical protein